jgi:hypothetical protein
MEILVNSTLGNYDEKELTNRIVPNVVHVSVD